MGPVFPNALMCMRKYFMAQALLVLAVPGSIACRSLSQLGWLPRPLARCIELHFYRITLCLYKGNKMKNFVAFSALFVAMMPAMATGAFNTVPEPGVLPLLAVTAVAYALARRLKK